MRAAWSRPARALWIEMDDEEDSEIVIDRRGPRGPCGLKCFGIILRKYATWSRPARALWIEILSVRRTRERL